MPLKVIANVTINDFSMARPLFRGFTCKPLPNDQKKLY